MPKQALRLTVGPFRFLGLQSLLLSPPQVSLISRQRTRTNSCGVSVETPARPVAALRGGEDAGSTTARSLVHCAVNLLGGIDVTPVSATAPTDEQPTAGDEEPLQPLSDRDRDLFLDLIENPPEPNAAFRKAAEAYRKRRGGVE